MQKIKLIQIFVPIIVAIMVTLTVKYTGATTSAWRWSYTTEGQWVQVAISSDGGYIAAASDKIYLFNKDSSIPMWTYDTTGDTTSKVAISKDGSYIAVGGSDRKVYLFGKDSNTPLWSYNTGNEVTCIDISADGSYIVVGTSVGYAGEPTIYLFLRDSSIPVWSRAEGMEVRALAISGDSGYIVAGMGGWPLPTDRVYLFSRDNETPLWWANVEAPTSVAISSEGKYIVTGDWTYNINLFARESSTPLWTYDAGGYVYEVDISANGEYIVAGASRGLLLFSHNSSEPIWKYESYIEHAAISFDGRHITAGGFYSGQVYFFSRDDDVPIWNYDVGNVVSSVSISSSGDYIAAGDRDQGNVYFFTTGPPPTVGKTIYVDDDFVDDPESHKWNTIQEGLDDTSPGDSVFVYAGTYYENVEITTVGITVRGEDKDTVILDAGGNGNGIYLWNADYVNIGAFTVQNSGSWDSAGIRLNSSSNSVITDTNVVNNPFSGITVGNSSLRNTITNNVISGNRWGIFLEYSTNNIIANNILYSNSIAVYPNYSSDNTMSNNTLVVNEVGIFAYDSTDTITNSILWANGDDLQGCTATYSDIEDGDPGEGNISADPMFVNAAGGDYHLQPGSPCIDKGTNISELPETDFEGDPRIIDGDNDGTATVDMGVDEYAMPQPQPDIKANGSDGPVSITPIDNANVTVSLDPGSFSGESCDWWIGALTPYGNFWLSTWGWIKYDWPISIGQIPLFDLPETELLNTPLPPGIYTLFFVLDDNPDGSFDMTWEDYVNVIVKGEGTASVPDLDTVFQGNAKPLVE